MSLRDAERRDDRPLDVILLDSAPLSCNPLPMTGMHISQASDCSRRSKKRMSLQDAVRGLAVNQTVLPLGAAGTNSQCPERSPDNGADEMRMLDNRYVGVGIYHAVYLIRARTAHVQGHFAELGGSLQEKGAVLRCPRTEMLAEK